MSLTIDIRDGAFLFGNFDAQKRYARRQAGGRLALASGITWRVGVHKTQNPNAPIGSPPVGTTATGWKWSLGVKGSANFVSFRDLENNLVRMDFATNPAPRIDVIEI